MNKYLKLALAAYPFAALAAGDETKKDEIESRAFKECTSYVLGAGVSYLYPVNDSFSLGVNFSGRYGIQESNGEAVLSAVVRYAVENSEYIDGVRFMVGAILGQKSGKVEFAEKTLLEEKDSSYFKGVSGAVLFEGIPSVMVGPYFEYSNRGDLLKNKVFSVGITVVPTYAVSSNVEVHAFVSGMYNFVVEEDLNSLVTDINAVSDKKQTELKALGDVDNEQSKQLRSDVEKLEGQKQTLKTTVSRYVKGGTKLAASLKI